MTKSVLQEGCIIAGNPARVIGTIEEFREKYASNVFDFREMSSSRKKEEILSHSEKWIRKGTN